MLGNLGWYTYVDSSEHVRLLSLTECTDQTEGTHITGVCTKVKNYGLNLGVGQGAPEVDIFKIQPGGQKSSTRSFLESPVGQPFMSASYQVAPGITYNQLGQGAWTGPGQWHNGVEGGNMTAINIYFTEIIITTRKMHGKNNIIGLMQSVIITSSRKFSLGGNISTDWSWTCLTRRRVQGGI